MSPVHKISVGPLEEMKLGTGMRKFCTFPPKLTHKSHFFAIEGHAEFSYSIPIEGYEIKALLSKDRPAAHFASGGNAKLRVYGGGQDPSIRIAGLPRKAVSVGSTGSLACGVF
jgi:hypothetical protein